MMPDNIKKHTDHGHVIDLLSLSLHIVKERIAGDKLDYPDRLRDAELKLEEAILLLREVQK